MGTSKNSLKPRWPIALLTSCLCLFASQSAFALRCDGGLVAEGDTKLSVLKKCGEPTWIDRWSEEAIQHPDTDFEHRVAGINERWIYNPGPTQFLRIISFKGSRVFSIETGSRGFSLVPGPRRCDFNTLSLGISSYEVAAQCGEPDLKEQRYETVTQKIAGGRKQVTVLVDEWTFNLGPTRFIRILIFYNGNLVDISLGEKGFSR